MLLGQMQCCLPQVTHLPAPPEPTGEVKHAAASLQARFTLKTGKFEGVREDEAEGLETDLAPQTSDTLRYAEGHCGFVDCCT